jgi:TolB-like protein
MKICKLALCLSVLLSACSTLDENASNSDFDGGKNQMESGNTRVLNNYKSDEMAPLEASAHFQNHYKNKFNQNGGEANAYAMSKLNPKNRNVNHYVRGLMQDLVSNLQYVNHSTPMMVTSFVYLDSDFSASNLLGNQIAESFIHEIHKFGIPVIDYKATDYIRITKTGDFALSRDFLELKADVKADYVLLGTLTKQQGGVLVNARIVGFESKAVVASAQGFLPADIANSLLNNNLVDGIKLVSQ